MQSHDTLKTTGTSEFDRLAVLTIQGGGIYGLNLLGQLNYLTKKQNIVPVAVAGNSAGSIVAVLYWAGYSPEKIRDIFANKAKEKKLTDFVHTKDASYKLSDFKQFKDNVKKFAESQFSNRQSTDSLSIYNKIITVTIQWLCTPCKFFRTLFFLYKIKNSATPYFKERGCFEGNEFIDEIDDLIRKSPQFKNKKLPTGRHLIFDDVRKLIEADETFNLPALFLTATNVTGRKLEVFNSLDKQYFNVPIAKAVRASAGFPVFFRPVECKDEQLAGWYADGGIVSNYPAWIYSKEFRLRLMRDPNYLPVASRPWTHFGLQLERSPIDSSVLNPSPILYASSLARLVLGGEARSELEARLENMISRSYTIQQPHDETGVPLNMDLLDVENVSSELVLDMFKRGEDAGAKLGKLSYTLPEPKLIEPILHKLINRALLAFSCKCIEFRCNVFIPSGIDLHIRYSVNMKAPSSDADGEDPTLNHDHDLVLRFDSGLTGLCLSLRRPLICNLQRIGEVARDDPELNLFGMTPNNQKKVRKDRTWLASIPIYDPFGSFPRDMTAAFKEVKLDHEFAHHHALSAHTDGAVLGILNLDANIEYDKIIPRLDPDPTKHHEDPRIECILQMMTATASEIGRHLAISLAKPMEG